MASAKQPDISVYCFDDVLVDGEHFRIRKSDAPRGRVVDQQELFDQIWKKNFVTGKALTNAVAVAQCVRLCPHTLIARHHPDKP